MTLATDTQPYVDRDVALTSRQQALLELCDAHGLVIYGGSTSGSEDIAAFFPLVLLPESTEDGVPTRLPANQQPERYCAVTRHEDFVYLYPLYRTLAAAKQRAVADVDDDIFSELPLEIVDLDTGKRWCAEITATWRARHPRTKDTNR